MTSIPSPIEPVQEYSKPRTPTTTYPKAITLELYEMLLAICILNYLLEINLKNNFLNYRLKNILKTI